MGINEPKKEIIAPKMGMSKKNGENEQGMGINEPKMGIKRDKKWGQ